MRPIPVAFHIGPLEVHTYGIGLAIAFWFGYRYLARRLRSHGYQDDWLAATFVWIVIGSIVGARAVHVLAHTRYYSAHPGDILAIWNGGLSSFGGLAIGILAGFLSARRRYPALRLPIAADLVAPVLVASWIVGRLLGPQMMFAGGGKPTSAWFGMYYAGEVGKRLPVPIFQAIECLVVFVIVLNLERLILRRGGPIGVVACAAAGLWGLSRFFDESVYLPHDNGTVGVEITGLAMFTIGLLIAIVLLAKDSSSHRPSHSTTPDEVALASKVSDPWAAPTSKAPACVEGDTASISTPGG